MCVGAMNEIQKETPLPRRSKSFSRYANRIPADITPALLGTGTVNDHRCEEVKLESEVKQVNR